MHNFAAEMIISLQTYNDFQNGILDSIYADTWASLMAFAARTLGDYHAMMAEDCVQEAIVASYNKRNDLTSPLHLKTFLFTCIHNNCINLLRKSSCQEKFISNSNPQDYEQEVSASIIEQETIDLLYTAIKGLPPQYREIFELSFEAGMKNAEAAESLGISLSAYNKRKNKMLATMRDKFTDNININILLSIIIA